jgi:hypothetical protein
LLPKHASRALICNHYSEDCFSLKVEFRHQKNPRDHQNARQSDRWFTVKILSLISCLDGLQRAADRYTYGGLADREAASGYVARKTCPNCNSPAILHIVPNCESALYSVRTLTRSVISVIQFTRLSALMEIVPQLAVKLFWSFSSERAIYLPVTSPRWPWVRTVYWRLTRAAADRRWYLRQASRPAAAEKPISKDCGARDLDVERIRLS